MTDNEKKLIVAIANIYKVALTDTGVTTSSPVWKAVKEATRLLSDLDADEYLTSVYKELAGEVQ